MFGLGVANKDGKAWQADSMSISYSTTKGVLSTLAHILVDEGLLSYDRPIADYWPAFAQNGKHGITLRHVLTHEAGLYHLRSMINDAREMLDWPHMLQMIEQAQTCSCRRCASGLSCDFFWLDCGWFNRKSDRRTFSANIGKKITQPLQLDGCYIGVPALNLGVVSKLLVRHATKPTNPPSKIANCNKN
jgi:CubicO group peptidase (beta-lactamase class C family)